MLCAVSVAEPEIGIGSWITGTSATVSVALDDTPPTVAVISAVPIARAETRPYLSTVATVGLEELQVAV